MPPRALILASILLIVSPAFAQEPERAPQDSQAAVPLQPIGEGDIPARADLVGADLRRIETLMQPTADIGRIGAALGSREAAIIALKAQLTSIDPATVSTRRVEDQRLQWLELQTEFSAWATIARDRFQDLQAERERLREARALWELTLERVDAEDVPPEPLQRVQTVLSRIIDVESRIRVRRNEIGAIVDRIGTNQDDVSEALGELDATGARVRGRLATRDAEPLWRVVDTLEPRSLSDEVLKSGREWLEGLGGYFGLRPARTAFLVVLFLVIAVVSVLWRRSSAGSQDDRNAPQIVPAIIDRPYSISLAVALATAVLILPSPVGSAVDLLIVLIAVPMLRLGPLLLQPAARRGLYPVVVLAIVARAASLVPDGSQTPRLLLLAVATLGFAGATRNVVRSGSLPGASPALQRAISAATSATAVILGMAVIANVLGWLKLSQLLTEATLLTLFAAFVWTIAVAFVAALLPVLIDGRLGRVLPSLRSNRASVVSVIVTAVAVVASLMWLRGSLSRFQLWEPLRDYAGHAAENAVSIGGISVSIGSVLGGALILVATWLTARFVGFVLREELLPRTGLRRGDAQSVVKMANYLVWGIGIVMVASAMGLTGTQLTVVIGAVSLGIGFGLQTIINNFVSGLILIFERPIRVGDVVQTVDHWGRVKQIGIRASIIRNFDGAEIVVPNGDLIAREVINWTRSDEIRRIEVLIGVAYGTDPEQVLEILLRVAQEHPATLEDPEPGAHMLRHGESSLDFRVRCWVPIERWVGVASDLNVAINREIKAAGITIPFPQRDLHIRSDATRAKGESAAAVDVVDSVE